jgi:hypothetical protein
MRDILVSKFLAEMCRIGLTGRLSCCAFAFLLVFAVGTALNCLGRNHGLSGCRHSGIAFRVYGWPLVFLDSVSKYDWKGTTQLLPIEGRLWRRDTGSSLSRFYVARAILDGAYWLTLAFGAFLVAARVGRTSTGSVTFQYSLRDLVALQIAVALIGSLHCSGFCDRW